MSNMELLSILYQNERLKRSEARNYKKAFMSSSFVDFSIGLKSTVYIGTLREKMQNCCSHPIGVKVGGSVYYPICEQELILGSVITIEKEAGGHNMGFIREKLAEILPLIPEVTPSQMVEYVDKELKTFSRQ